MVEKWIPEPSFDVRAVVKTDHKRDLHYPEVMFYGANYAVGLSYDTYDQAKARAQEVTDKITKDLLKVVEQVSQTYSIAKP